jgi:hypothetical protein
VCTSSELDDMLRVDQRSGTALRAVVCGRDESPFFHSFRLRRRSSRAFVRRAAKEFFLLHVVVPFSAALSAAREEKLPG